MSNLFNATRVTATVGGKEIIMETGRFANQADGAVCIQCGGSMVLATVCASPLEREVDFFPLVVDYTERMYAAGRIPGNFFRREIGRPSERETLVSRVIDRPLRPLFPKGLKEDVQIMATVISADQENETDVLSLCAASAATVISGVPFADTPVAGGRIGRINGEFVLNPTIQEMAQADLNLIIAATRDAIVMVEGGANFLPETVISEALVWAHREMQPLITMQEELRALVGKTKRPFVAPVEDTEMIARVEELAYAGLDAALQVAEKMARKEAKKEVKNVVKAALLEDPAYAENPARLAALGDMLSALEKRIVRARIVNENKRIDGRDTKTVRPIRIEAGLLPRAHGSALFSRGETKSLVTTTLGSSTDELRTDSLCGDINKRFMLHYNFPSYSVGEVKPSRLSRREIGHGALAERALRPIMPKDDFPFTVRIVSDTMESNGSSSMAAVCGGCMSLMDAGVPISAPVAGIAMGLIKEGDKFVVLTDILGDEDALGDMDFKIAGTRDGVTAVQMDIKIDGLPAEVMARALTQAHEARMHILDQMASVLPAPRTELSQYAPQMCVVDLNPELIRVVIGPGGKNIKAITAATGASIDIEDSGKVSIFAPTLQALEQAKEMVLYYDQHADLGKNYVAKVRKIMEIGAIVELLPNVEALVHISQLDTARVEKTEDVVQLGQDLEVKVIEINNGRVRASRKAVLLEAQGIAWDPADTARPERRSGDRNDRGGDRRGGDRGGRGGDRGDRGGRGRY